MLNNIEYCHNVILIVSPIELRHTGGVHLHFITSPLVSQCTAVFVPIDVVGTTQKGYLKTRVTYGGMARN